MENLSFWQTDARAQKGNHVTLQTLPKFQFLYLTFIYFTNISLYLEVFAHYKVHFHCSQWKPDCGIKLMENNFTKHHLAPAAQVPGPVWKDSVLPHTRQAGFAYPGQQKLVKTIYFLLRLLLCKAPTPEFCLTVILLMMRQLHRVQHKFRFAHHQDLPG